MKQNEGVSAASCDVSLADMMVTALRHTPERPTIILQDGETLSAGDVEKIISQYVQAFHACGLKRRDCAAILSGNRVEVLHFTNACILAGVVVVALPPMGSLEDHLFMLRDSEAHALFFDPGGHDERAAAIDRGHPLPMQLSIGPSARCAKAMDLRALARTFDAQPLQPPAFPPEQILRLAYSGGTTGRPKAIVLDHRSLTACLNIQLAEWDWPQEMRQLICAPLSHSGAACFLPTLMRSGALIVLPRFEPVAVMEAIEKHRITCVLLVPTMIYALLDHPRFGEFDLSSLEAIYYGASAMSPVRLREAIKRIGPVFCQFYGQSEAPMTVTVLRKSEHSLDDPERLRTCGRPVPQIRFALLDDDGQPAPDGTPGEICVAGPLVMQGYWRQPELTAAAIKNGWLHTGDVGVRDASGFVTLVDRKKDMIITGGFNVYPREVETVLASHAAVLDAAVVGVPHDRWGEEVTALIVLRPDATCSAEELIALVRERKGSVQAPKHVYFVDAIPLTSVGKPDKKAIRARLSQKASQHA